MPNDMSRPERTITQRIILNLESDYLVMKDRDFIFDFTTNRSWARK